MADKYFVFESQSLTCHVNGEEVFCLIRVYYNLDAQPWEIELITNTDTGQHYAFHDLPVMDGLYLVKRLGELAGENAPFKRD